MLETLPNPKLNLIYSYFLNDKSATQKPILKIKDSNTIAIQRYTYLILAQWEMTVRKHQRPFFSMLNYCVSIRENFAHTVKKTHSKSIGLNLS